MDELLQYLVTKIVNNPDDVVIDREDDGEIVRFGITVHPEDAGLVIGKEGKVINAIRNLVKIQAIKENKRVYLDLRNEKPENAEQASE